MSKVAETLIKTDNLGIFIHNIGIRMLLLYRLN